MKYKLIRKPSGTVGGALYTMDVKPTETLVQKPVPESTEVEVRNEGGDMSPETEEEIRYGEESRDQGQELYVAEDIEGGKTKSPSFLSTMRILPRKRKVANKPEPDHEPAEQEQEQTTPSPDVMEKTEQPSIPESSKPIAPSCNLVKKKEPCGMMRCAQTDDNDNLVSVRSQDRPKTTAEVANGMPTTARAAALDNKFNYDENISLEESAIGSQRSTTETDGYSRSEYDSNDDDDDNDNSDDDDDDDESDGEEDQTVLIDSSTVTERKVETGWFSGFRVLPDSAAVGAVGAAPGDLTIVASRDLSETKEPEAPMDPKSTDKCSESPDGSTMTPIFFDVTKVVESPQEEVVREEQKEFGLDEYKKQQKADFRRKWLRLLTLQGMTARRSFPTRNCSKNGNNSARLRSSVDTKSNDGTTSSLGNPPSQVRQIGARRPVWRPVLALKNAGASIRRRFWKRKDRCLVPKDGQLHSDQHNDDDDDDDGLSVYSKELSSHPKSDDDPWGIFVSFWTSTVTCPGG
ncbi:hypothetical protein IV203_011425 [Nitzschia inconspicua]|uniref:Uncharacterized protein n=1 Tax=Nitzschia inconspicua TaxID=303405 RepID=A0A9K3KTM0_9STRA|nr:hypothetical protein IV203_011425 [Nitzschia inconspicua]